jgi:hypothetical protein
MNRTQDFERKLKTAKVQIEGMRCAKAHARTAVDRAAGDIRAVMDRLRVMERDLESGKFAEQGHVVFRVRARVDSEIKELDGCCRLLRRVWEDMAAD